MTSGQNRLLMLEGHLSAAELSARIPGLVLDTQDENETEGDISQPFALLDSHDQNLRLRDMVLITIADELTLLGDGPTLHQPSGGADFPSDLPEGPIQALCLKAFPLRRLLKQVEGQVKRHSLRLLDDENKTLLRGELLRMETAQGAMSLLHFTPLRGYAKAAAGLTRSLTQLGADEVSAGAIYQTLCPPQDIYVAKPRLQLTGQETAFEVAAQTMHNFLAVARQNEVGVIADLDTEFLHDYRVALRKIRSVLSQFKGVFGEVQTTDLKTRFAALMAPTGRLRDLDVYLLDRHAYDHLVPEGMLPGLQVMFDAFDRERSGAHRDLVAYLQSPAYRTEIEALAEFIATPEGFVRGEAGALPAAEYARRLIWKGYRKTCKIAAQIHALTPDEEVHELRIAFKKLRYLIEFFRPLFPRGEARAVLKEMKELQDTLGRFNDFSVQQESLRGFLDENPVMRGKDGVLAAQSIGALIAVLAVRQREERDKVVAAFERFNSAQTQARIRILSAKDPTSKRSTTSQTSKTPKSKARKKTARKGTPS